VIYEVNYNGWMLYVSNYLHSHIRLERLLYDAEHDLLAIAKFLVRVCAFAMKLNSCMKDEKGKWVEWEE